MGNIDLLTIITRKIYSKKSSLKSIYYIYGIDKVLPRFYVFLT